MTEKKLPERTCAGCGIKKPKKDFVRMVRTPDGNIVLDLTGKINGRGVYLCNDKKCLEKAMKNRRPDRSFKMAVPQEVYEEMKKHLGEEE